MYSASSTIQLVIGRMNMGSEEKRALLVAFSLLIHDEITYCVPQKSGHFGVTALHIFT
jgi:hypothetical protein